MTNNKTGMKILVVDDRQDDRESLVELLTTYGYRPVGVASGRLALQYLEANRVDLALVDVVMPDLDGIAVLREIKARLLELEVILITAYGSLEKALAGIKEGAYDFLNKPFSPEELIAAVERVREKRALQDNAREHERRRRKSDNFMHSMMENLSEAVVVIGRNLRIISANRGYLRQSKMREEEIIGRHCYRVSHGYSRPCWLEENCVCAVISAFKDGRPHTAVHVHRARGGEPLHVETTAYPLRDEQGRIYAAVEIVRDITDLKMMEEEKQAKEAEIHRLAFYDVLTGLPNRRLLLDRLGQSLAASVRSGQFGALLFLGLDHFKRVNDTCGHQTGDLIIQEAALRLQKTVRGDDTVSRQSGDEFMILLQNLSADGEKAIKRAGQVAENLRLALEQPFLIAGRVHEHEFHLSASIGVTLFYSHQETAEELFKYADTAMHQAKQAGRNSVRFFDPNMQKALEETVALERDLRRAVAEDQFELYYQPQVDGAGRLIGAEALLRWRQSSHCVVSPRDFIPLTEENGLILPIGRWVLRKACAQLVDWDRRFGPGNFRLAVNVSARQFHQPGFVSEVREIMGVTGVDPRRLKLELTETMIMTNLEDAAAKMRQLQGDGLGFALDDFGTGYSSLAKLKRLPLEQLKIDRSFVCDLEGESHDAAIVETILAMGRTLGLEVVAEGVETAEQLQFLQHHGCKIFQGYLFNPPLPTAEFEGLLV